MGTNYLVAAIPEKMGLPPWIRSPSLPRDTRMTDEKGLLSAGNGSQIYKEWM